MAIEGQPRSLTEVLTKERYGDVTGQLGDKLPHSKQGKLGLFRIDQRVLSATSL